LRARPDPDRDFPWWLLAVVVLLGAAYVMVLTDDATRQVLLTLRKGIWITILVTVTGFSAASLVGLGLALMLLSGSLVARQAARFYVEIIRGIPILVMLLYVAFVLAPGLVALWNWMGLPDARTRDFPLLWRAVLALVIAYSAFIAEVFRAGLQSVDKGQIEAARALGLKRFRVFRHIVLPQAIRTILPPLGNDFVAMVKDSSLVSVVGVLDIAQLGKLTAAGNFRYFETYNVVALIYLTMTILLSLGLRKLERKLGKVHK
jgi:His/Glu/Gln/Arg/opine family amino acid ABC transporter permease subunit